MQRCLFSLQPVRFHTCKLIAINYTPQAETANVSYLSYHLLLWKSQETDSFCYIFLQLFVKLRLKRQRTTICKYFYSLPIKNCLLFAVRAKIGHYYWRQLLNGFKVSHFAVQLENSTRKLFQHDPLDQGGDERRAKRTKLRIHSKQNLRNNSTLIHLRKPHSRVPEATSPEAHRAISWRWSKLPVADWRLCEARLHI